jgi:probable poly-beta-1,6-N-acetyl-D-glucosamine export protein
MAKRLLLLNGVAIVCVVLFHATGFGYTAMFAWAHRYKDAGAPPYEDVGTAAYYALRLVEQFVVFCIPAFLFVSGFFVSVLAGRAGVLERRAVTARVRALLIPYLLWSALILVGFALEGRVYSIAQYARFLLTGSTNANYYYVPMLVQLYLVAPLVVVLAIRYWKALLVGAGVLQVFVYILQYSAVLGAEVPGLPQAAWLPKWLFVAHFFWFASGVVVGFQQQRFKELIQRWRRPLLVSACLLFVAGLVEWELLVAWSGSPWRENRVTLIDGLYAASAILAFLAFTEVSVPFPAVLVELGSRSFGIYLVHGVVMEYFSRGLYHLAPWILGQQWLFQPLLIALGLSVPLILMGLVRRTPTRNLYGYVFG